MGLLRFLQVFFLGGHLLGQHPEAVPGLLEFFLETGGLFVKGFLVCLQGCNDLTELSGLFFELLIHALELFQLMREFPLSLRF